MGRYVLGMLILLLAIPLAQAAVINDASRLNPTEVDSVVVHDDVVGLQDALRRAREENLSVSIAGKRHSMGGHAFYPGAVVLDMTSFNKVLGIDPEQRIITVQSGATWDQVIAAADEHNLSVQVMQAYTGFTIGGSMSVNVHESDPRFGPMVKSVHAFRLLLPNGTILNVSRTEHPELFSLVIGGYGLFGIILDVDLYLTENRMYEKEEYLISYEDYCALFRNVTSDPGVEQVFARLSIAPDDTLLREVIVTTYETTDEGEYALQPSSGMRLKRFLFGLSRTYNWGKHLRWYLQREHSDRFEPAVISRNNLMNSDVSYLAYDSPRDTDILQEYFVPADQLAPFIDDVRTVVEEEDLNLLSATIRHVPYNNESVLSYSMANESFGVVLYFNVGLSDAEQEDVRQWTQEILDRSLERNGTYYLPYQHYASHEQIRRAYPRIDEFFGMKRQHDPEGLFMNRFYSTYAIERATASS